MPIGHVIEFSQPALSHSSCPENRERTSANVSPYLAAAVWTRDLSQAHRMAAKLRAGTVWINCYNVFDNALPFGGYKQSGWGRESGHAVLEMYTEIKSVCTQI